MKHYYISEDFCKANNFSRKWDFIGYKYVFNELEINFDQCGAWGYALNGNDLFSYSNEKEEEDKLYMDDFVRGYLTEESIMEIKEYLNQFNIELELESDEF